MITRASLAAFVMLLPVGLPQRHPVDAPLPRTAINDNSKPAGRMTGAMLAVHLTVGRTEWFPEAEDGPSVEALAFGEAGKRMSIPGPLIRVVAGTRVHVTLTNPLAETLTVHGLFDRPGAPRAV
ncbi:MAG: hypothetical protein M3403_00130, partial [Gemmatimonadota bacterium]|nr:hypothetical protein [Gemmatimonadota bacterium]